MEEKILEVTMKETDEDIFVNVNNLAKSKNGKKMAKQILQTIISNLDYDEIECAKAVTEKGEVKLK